MFIQPVVLKRIIIEKFFFLDYWADAGVVLLLSPTWKGETLSLRVKKEELAFFLLNF